MTRPSILLALGFLAGSAVLQSQPSDVTAAIRPLLENSLREQAGIGFVEFSCDVEPPLGPGQLFDCTALDEEGDRLRYTLEIDDEGTASVVRASQPPGSLPAELRAALSAPCSRFLDAFEKRQWDRLLDDLHPALRDELDRERIGARLADVRAVLGAVETPVARWYTASGSGLPELEYALPAQTSGAVARFRLDGIAEEEWRIIAFIVTAEAGTAASQRLIADRARLVLAQVLGSSVERVEGPFEQLAAPGDMVEATAWLEDGSRMPVVAQQTGDLGDFDDNDYFFSVLDAELIVRRGVEGRIEGVTGVECEAPTVPDGGEVRCVVEREGAAPVELFLSRRGVEHRMRSESANG